MKTTRNNILMGALTALALATTVCAQVPAARIQTTPGIINYQGRLLTPAGNVYSNGVYNIEFRIYEADTGVTPLLWGCAYPVYVKEGYFNVMLGGPGGAAVTPAPTYGPMDLWRALWYDANTPAKANDRYLGITVTMGPDASLPTPAVEAFPRQRFLSAPFAERAQMAEYARASYDTFTVGSTLTAAGLVTAAGGLTVQNNTTLANTTVNGSTTLNQGATVNNQQAVFNRGVSVNGATAYVNSGLEVIGPALLKGGVNVGSAKVQENGSDLIPRGVIVMWSGTTAPAGWALCNGANSTPDLRGRFVLGYGAGPGLTPRTTIGVPAGEEYHTLSIGEMPYHSHNWNRGIEGDDSGSGGSWWEFTGTGGSFGWGDPIGYSGGNWAHNNMPPYYVLAYIMKL